MVDICSPKTELGRKILELLKRLPVGSFSHDLSHHLRALRNAQKLYRLYGGDLEVIEAAVLLHDIAKLLDARIKHHAAISAEIAGALLHAMGAPKEKIEKVKEAVLHHDDMPFNCSAVSIEARIVHDADWLDGFGALGVIRIAMVAGEKGREITKIIEKIEVEMKKRLENLCFEESRRYAVKKWEFVGEFLQELKEELAQGPL